MNYIKENSGKLCIPRAGRFRLASESKGVILHDSGWQCNLIVNTAYQGIIEALMGNLDPAVDMKIAIGTGTTAPNTAQTSLVAQVAQGGSPYFSRSGTTWQIRDVITGSWAGNYSEAGLFLGSYMISRVLFSGEKMVDGIVAGYWELDFI